MTVRLNHEIFMMNIEWWVDSELNFMLFSHTLNSTVSINTLISDNEWYILANTYQDNTIYVTISSIT